MATKTKIWDGCFHVRQLIDDVWQMIEMDDRLQWTEQRNDGSWEELAWQAAQAWQKDDVVELRAVARRALKTDLCWLWQARVTEALAFLDAAIADLQTRA